MPRRIEQMPRPIDSPNLIAIKKVGEIIKKGVYRECSIGNELQIVDVERHRLIRIIPQLDSSELYRQVVIGVVEHNEILASQVSRVLNKTRYKVNREDVEVYIGPSISRRRFSFYIKVAERMRIEEEQPLATSRFH